MIFDKTDEELERFEKDWNAHSAYVFFECVYRNRIILTKTEG